MIVYEWLTGELPFIGSFTEIIAQHLTLPPPSLCEKVPSLSPAVEQVVLTALNKDPKARYGSVQAFATALTDAIQNPSAARASTWASARLAPALPSPGTSMSNATSPKVSAGRRVIGIALLASVLLIALLSGVMVGFPNLFSMNNRSSVSLSPPSPTTATAQSVLTSTSTTIPTLTPTALPPIPTATATPSSGVVLYRANWSSGMNGWSASDQWKASDGMLLSDGSVSPNHSNTMDYVTLAPYQPGARTNYAVEVRMQLIRAVDTYNGCYFGVMTRLVAPGQGYLSVVGPNGQTSGGAPSAQIQIYTINTTLSQASYNPGLAWHVYRVEVNDTHIRLLVDGVLVTQATDTSFTSGGQVGLQTYACQLAVSSFIVYSL